MSKTVWLSVAALLPGALVAQTTQTDEIVQVSVYNQVRHACLLRETLRHTVTGIGIVGAGPGIVIDDAITLEEIQHLFDVLLFGLV
jgi:hypothetical protein